MKYEQNTELQEATEDERVGYTLAIYASALFQFTSLVATAPEMLAFANGFNLRLNPTISLIDVCVLLFYLCFRLLIIFALLTCRLLAPLSQPRNCFAR